MTWVLAKIRAAGALIAVVVLVACSGSSTAAEDSPQATDTDATAEEQRGSTGPDQSEERSEPETETETDAPEPQAYVPADRPGSADAFAELIDRVSLEVPASLRNEVPWPDLRNANPITVQIEIFDLWIWMAENHPNPRLVEVMAAPNSPSREQIVTVFGELERERVFEVRNGAQYEAFDHRVVTFESAGLPRWLSDGVPDDAVVVYYRDRSGSVDVIDQDTGATVGTFPAVAERAWLSIIVPTDVGWQLWRDQLIEPNDAELEFPDVPPPGASEERRRPDL